MQGEELFGYYECEKGGEYAAKVQAESNVVKKFPGTIFPRHAYFSIVATLPFFVFQAFPMRRWTDRP